MLQRGQYFPGQRKDEQIVLFARSHWLSFLPWILIILAMIIVPTIIVLFLLPSNPSILSNSFRPYIIIGGASYILIAIAVFFTAWISYYLNVIIVTPEHLIDISQTGLFNRKVSEQSLLRVQDVSARVQGLLQTFFRYGTVEVETAGDIPNFEIQNVPYPTRVANKILQLHEELVQATGYSEEDLAEGIGMEPSSFEVPKVGTEPKPGEQKEKIAVPESELIKLTRPQQETPLPQNNSTIEEKLDVKPTNRMLKEELGNVPSIDPGQQNIEISKEEFPDDKIENKNKKDDEEDTGELKEGESIKL